MFATRLLRISGRVQGVGFREHLRREAERHHLSGWVRNRQDGTVEALLQGPADGVAAVAAWAHRGPPAARVDQVRESEPTPSDLALSPGGPGSGFARLPTR